MQAPAVPGASNPTHSFAHEASAVALNERCDRHEG